MWAGIAAAAVSAAASLLGNSQTGSSSKKAARTQFHRENYLMDKQFDNDLKMWNMQNEYNSPLNQMKRLQEAGLNPNLMYSSGNVGNATSMPTMSKGSASKAEGMKYDFDFDKLMPLFQMRNLESQNQLINAQTVAAQEDAKNKALANVRYGIENQYLPEQLQANINKTKKETEIAGRNNSPLNRVGNGVLDFLGNYNPGEVSSVFINKGNGRTFEEEMNYRRGLRKKYGNLGWYGHYGE